MATENSFFLTVFNAKLCNLMMTKVISSMLIIFASFSTAMAKTDTRIIQDKSGSYELIVNGTPFFANGVGGSKNLPMLKKLGGNTFRTWGIEELAAEIQGKPILDYANDLGLKVIAGIWIGHERHGFDYGDPQQIKDQRNAVKEAVKRYKDHPAILAWGLGNEMEDPVNGSGNTRIWKELNELAKIVKREDSSRPVMTVIAGTGGDKVVQIIRHYPEIDILGVNAYASAPAVASDLLSLGWEKPFMLTEFGPLGHWEVQSTSWGAPIEPNSQQKAGTYYVTHQRVIEEGMGQCLGTFAFLWGNKQECTATWYGMFLPSGERLGSADAMSYAWTGNFPDNRAPKIRSLDSSAAMQEIARGSIQTASVEITDPENDPLEYEWIVTAESNDRRVGGDKESVPPSFPNLITSQKNNQVTFKAPNKSGAYRLFLYARDRGNGNAATANFPFYVK